LGGEAVWALPLDAAVKLYAVVGGTFGLNVIDHIAVPLPHDEGCWAGCIIETQPKLVACVAVVTDEVASSPADNSKWVGLGTIWAGEGKLPEWAAVNFSVGNGNCIMIFLWHVVGPCIRNIE